MLRRFRISVATLAALALLSMPVAGWAETNVDRLDSSNASPMMDVMVLRPLGLVLLGASAVLFVPMAAVTGITRPHEMGQTVDHMLVEPARYVFQDPLGSH